MHGTLTFKLYAPLEYYLQPQVLARRDSCSKCNSCCRKFRSLYKGPITVADLIRIVYGTEVPISDSEYYRHGWRDPKEIGDEEVRLGTGYGYCAIKIKAPAVRFTDEECTEIMTSAKRRNGIFAPHVHNSFEITFNCLMRKPVIKWEHHTVLAEGKWAEHAVGNAKKMMYSDSSCAYADPINVVQQAGGRLVPTFNVKCADCKYCEHKDGAYFCNRFGVNVNEYESCEKGV